VIVPGIWNSGAEHWQSHWERAWGDSAVRIEPSSWDRPDRHDWIAAIDRAVRSCDVQPVLVAHSLGVLAAYAWLAEHDGAAAGAFLVAPPDPDGPAFPEEASTFLAPTAPIATPTALVVSDDDPFCPLDTAIGMARRAGSTVLRVGALGHVNVAAGVGAWPEGRSLLAAFESDTAAVGH
jgi:uncharacterized protein